MIGFAQGVLVGLSLGGVWVGSCIGKSIAYGLGSGLTSGIIAIALDKLLGRKVSSAYLAAVVIYGIGKVWNKAVDPINTKPSTIPLYKRFTKDDLCRLTKENLEFISQRCYTNDSDESQNVVQLKSGDALCQQSERFEALSQVSTQPRYTETKITVINQDFLDAACEEVKQGHQVAVVSFGSPREPGGGFEEGTIGQEEELCYRSELAGFMYDQVYDKLGTDLQLYPIYDRLIHTPHVQVFRAGREKSYTLLSNPFEIGVLSVPAPVKPALSGVGTDFIDYAKPEEKQKVINLIVTQLYIAYVKGYDTIVLGAFGCGAFQNPPQSVAKIYQDVIKASFKGAFKKIVFAILDDPLSKSVHNPTGNFKPFEICFRAS